MIKKLLNCFDKDCVNTGRQRELDIAKGIFAVFMSLSHCIEILGWFFDPERSDGLLWHNVDMVIKSAVLVVVTCMGISLCYSSRRSAEALARRAFSMLGIVALLELFRTVVPCFIEWLIFRDFESIRYAYQFLCVDIFQFVTLAWLVIALFKKLKLKPVMMILIASLLSVVGQLLRGVSTGSSVGDFAVGYLWHSHDASYFPLLNWLVAPVIGYALGHAWLRLRDKETFFRIVTPISWVILALYFGSMILAGKWYYFSNESFCGIGLVDVLFMSITFPAVAGVGYFMQKILPRLSGWFESLGVRICSFYCIHWVVYSFLYLTLLCVLDDNFLPGWVVAPTAVLVLLVADALSRLYKRIVTKRENEGKRIS